jgi:hypothetical protein
MVYCVLFFILNHFVSKLVLGISSEYLIIDLLKHVILFVFFNSILVLKFEELLSLEWDVFEAKSNDWIIELTAVWISFLPELLRDVYLLTKRNVMNEEPLYQLINLQPSINNQ